MNIDINDIMSCEKCGIVFDITQVKTIKGKNEWDSDEYVCPLCKHKSICWRN